MNKSKIISYLEDNIDRICVSLVCKRWFNERDKYLYFNTDSIRMNNFIKEEDGNFDENEEDEEIINNRKNSPNIDDRISQNITKFYLDSYDDLLNNIKSIYGMISNSNVSILKGISSLSNLVIDYSQTLQVGSLPPNLKVLVHLGKSKISSDGVLPQSLCTLKSPISWIPFIKSLNNLTTLTLYQSDNSIITIDLSELPDSLTSLKILYFCRLISTLSPSIRYLDIHQTQYDIDEIFKNRSQYHFERLTINGYKQESLDNMKTRELKIDW
ncbi:hypothetical protein PPL_08508 [Heterostelium album PN500]|uniref:COI1 F-box domain-containing protein n=1 Tax=Heterostelium pallidum (strain ATCC 26659 / Pp 5 / PN500) TaxID=670386 RepID=D3BID8_HETP5|nr:hypothetical protein PPL_08508 [Heterostelium album PN500]EFA79038.1 hypothetical protein PPL_08508 [Heterostelium album PN500]|eukprot:XP_020431161.1 hypothetical protein PPL_08508 [Heterostelium album PN500]